MGEIIKSSGEYVGNYKPRNRRLFGGIHRIDSINEIHQVEIAENYEQESSLISMASIFSIQALGMQLREQARTRLKATKGKYGFSMLDCMDSDEHVAYDGSLEEYMTFRVAKPEHNQWRMRVSFRQNQLSEETNQESYIDDYVFDWLRNGTRQAAYMNRRTSIEGDATTHIIRDTHQITDDEAKALRKRMMDHATMYRLKDDLNSELIDIL